MVKPRIQAIHLGLFGLLTVAVGLAVVGWDIAEAIRDSQAKLKELRPPAGIESGDGVAIYSVYSDVSPSLLGLGLALCASGVILASGAFLYRRRHPST